MVEGARLESVCRGNPPTVGSNPTLSAILVPLIFLVSVLPTLAQNQSVGRVEIVGGVAAIDSSARSEVSGRDGSSAAGGTPRLG